MRKITKEAVEAFNTGIQWRSSNTEVINDNGTIYMLLHGNYIAKKQNNQLCVNHAGWMTNTTKERLNGLDGVDIVQKNFVWFLNGKPMKSGWNLIS